MKKILLIVIFSAFLALIPLTIAWILHQLITGLNPFLAIIVMPLFLVIAVFIFRFLFKTFKKYVSCTPDVLFAIASLSYLILMSVLYLFYGNSTLDIHMHDTYYVVAIYYPMSIATIGFALFAALYYWVYKVRGKQMNDTLSYIHFWITFLATSFIVLPVHYDGLAGMPRRYYDFSDGSVFDALFQYNAFISAIGLLLLIAQLIFLYNFINTVFKRSILNKSTN